MPPEPRPHLRALQPAYHGSISAAEAGSFGYALADILDFSVSTNPFGPSPAVREALRTVDPARYPDDEATDLRAELGARIGALPDCLLMGNGSSEIIWLAAHAFLKPGDRAVVVGPTYGEYARSVRQAGAEPAEWRAAASSRFAVDLERVSERAASLPAKIVFVANPNNPTGHYLPPAKLARLAAELPDTLIAIDEAYLPFVESAEPSGHLMDHPNVLRIRSLTKDCGLAGLRLGYALAHPDLLRPLAALRPPWSVSVAAQAAGLAALRDRDHWQRARSEIIEAKRLLSAGFTARGYTVIPSAANFLLVQVEDGAALRERLLRQGICVRDCASFGLPDSIRVGIRPVEACQRLLAALPAASLVAAP